MTASRGFVGGNVCAGLCLLALVACSSASSSSADASVDPIAAPEVTPTDGGMDASRDVGDEEDDHAIDAAIDAPSPEGSDASPRITKIALGASHGCAMTSSGGVVCLGRNEEGELGRGTMGGTSFDVLPVWGLASGVTDISAGGNSTCVMLGESVQCWGSNALGQLGTGDRTSRFVPTQVSGLATGVVAISTVDDSACAIVASGNVRCWGSNQYGQLGTSATIDDCAGVPCAMTPVEVVGLPSAAIAISVGVAFACALLEDGSVMCWGYGEFGQLGASLLPSQCNGVGCSASPLRVEGLPNDVAALSAGSRGACALTRGGNVMCWGASDQEQLGKGSSSFTCNGRTCSSTPVKIAGLPSGITAIATAGFVSCALAPGGDVLCWGGNYYGTLGNGSTTKVPSGDPVQPLGLTSGVTSITAASSICAVVASGHVECWGFASIWTAYDTRYSPAPIVGL